MSAGSSRPAPGAAIPGTLDLPTLLARSRGLVYAAYFALAAFLQAPLGDNELLSFPLVQLPLEMISQEGSRDFLCNKRMWLGFGSLVIFGLNA